MEQIQCGTGEDRLAHHCRVQTLREIKVSDNKCQITNVMTISPAFMTPFKCAGIYDIYDQKMKMCEETCAQHRLLSRQLEGTQTPQERVDEFGEGKKEYKA